MPTNPPEPAPEAEKPVAGQPEGKARYVYRRCIEAVPEELWEVGQLDESGRWKGHMLFSTPEAAAIAATRMNGNEPDVDGGELFQ